MTTRSDHQHSSRFLAFIKWNSASAGTASAGLLYVAIENDMTCFRVLSWDALFSSSVGQLLLILANKVQRECTITLHLFQTCCFRGMAKEMLNSLLHFYVQSYKVSAQFKRSHSCASLFCTSSSARHEDSRRPAVDLSADSWKERLSRAFMKKLPFPLLVTIMFVHGGPQSSLCAW